MRTQLISYLDAGGSVYFEGNDIGYNNKSYDIWPYTGLSYVGDGAAATTGNVQNITGSGMCAGMGFDYPWKSEADGYVDDFSANGGTIVFSSQDGKGRVGIYSGPSNNYRTITSSIFFSVFQEDGTTRQQLMQAYMDFFTGGTAIEDELAGLLNPVAVSAASPVTGMFSVSIDLPVDTRCRLDVRDITGRRVGTLVNSTLSPGNHLLSLAGEHLSPGTYFITGNAGDEMISERTVLLR